MCRAPCRYVAVDAANLRSPAMDPGRSRTTRGEMHPPGAFRVALEAQTKDRRHGGHFVLSVVIWWATLDSNQ
jgi:hypothetical protein